MKKIALLSLILVAAAANTGCGISVRYVTATKWKGTPGAVMTRGTYANNAAATTTDSAVAETNATISDKSLLAMQGAKPPVAGAKAPAAAPPPAAAPAAPAAAPAAPAPAAAAGAGDRVFYLAYWEGTCGGIGGGCSKGNGKILRCNLGSDNALNCKEETDVNKFLSTD